MTMEENYVGYLLNALESDEQAAIERRLRDQPEEQARLELLRQALAPLAVDREPPEPPAGLWVRTLSRLAEHQCNPEEERPAVLRLPRRGEVGGGRPSWRRADLLVAASIFLCVGLLIPPGLGYLHYQHDKAMCSDNMRVFYGALSTYGDQHDGKLPDVTTVNSTHGVAGMVVPILYDSGHLDDSFHARCPGTGRHLRSSNLQVDKLKQLNPEEFAHVSPHLSGCYAYTLGYRDANGKYHSPQLDSRDQTLPILGDRPPLDVAGGNPGNSPNHGGRGQNVLFADGHTEFRPTRFSDASDDIYLSHNKKVEAGTNRNDAVLGDSSSRP